MQVSKRATVTILLVLAWMWLASGLNFTPINSAAPSSGEPRVTTWEPAVGEGYAVLYGTIEDEGNSEIEEFGFYVGSPGYEDKEIKIKFEGRIDDNDTFQYKLSGLDDAVVYYVRAYAINDDGDGYGSLLYFEVDKAPKSKRFHCWLHPIQPVGYAQGNGCGSLYQGQPHLYANPLRCLCHGPD